MVCLSNIDCREFFELRSRNDCARPTLLFLSNTGSNDSLYIKESNDI